MIYLQKSIVCAFLSLIFLVQVDGIAAQEYRPSAPIKLKVLLTPFLSQAPFLIAKEEGYFTEQGFQVDFVRMNRAHEAIPALIQGLLDVVPGTINITFLNAMVRET